MVEYALQRPELLAILDAIQVESVVGIAQEPLFPTDAGQRRAIVAQGVAQLQARQLLLPRDGEAPILDRDLFAAVSAIAFPDIVFRIIRNVTGVGPQLFLEYVSANLVVEQTFPAEGLHRLALLGDLATLPPRLGEIIPLPSDDEAPDPLLQITLAQESFFTVERLIREQRRDEAYRVLKQSASDDSAIQQLLSALEHPTFQGNVALLRSRDGQISDARNAAIVRDAACAWLIAQRTPGEPLLDIRTITASQAHATLAQWYDELAADR